MSDPKFDVLRNRDYAIAIDRSGSMGSPVKGTKTRFQWAQEQTEAIARVCQTFDPDGIDVHMFNNRVVTNKNVTPDKVTQVFKENQPGGGTATDEVLKVIFDDYFKRKAAGNAHPLTAVIVTDGEPNERRDVEKVIIEATQKMDKDEELSLLFVQVGDDQTCRDWLKKLDDDLTKNGAKFDIVDTKNDAEMDNLSIEELLLESIND